MKHDAFANPNGSDLADFSARFPGKMKELRRRAGGDFLSRTSAQAGECRRMSKYEASKSMNWRF
ncbi:MAG: hypothetical protein ABWX67_03430 [Allosphingosinicella sp.]